MDWIIQGVPPFRVVQTGELPTDYQWDGYQLRLLYDTIPAGSFDILLPVQCSTFRPPWGGWVDSSQHTWTAPDVLSYTATRPGYSNILVTFSPGDGPLGVNAYQSGTPAESLFATEPGGYQPEFVGVNIAEINLHFATDITGETGIRYVAGGTGVFNWQGRNPDGVVVNIN